MKSERVNIFDYQLQCAFVVLSYCVLKQVVWPPGAADTVCPRSRAINPTSQAFIAGRGI